jgi:hypothetical protein
MQGTFLSQVHPYLSSLAIKRVENTKWLDKLHIHFHDEEGDFRIIIEWDEKDPDLEWWSSLTDDDRRAFFRNALSGYLTDPID